MTKAWADTIEDDQYLSAAGETTEQVAKRLGIAVRTLYGVRQRARQFAEEEEA